MKYLTTLLLFSMVAAAPVAVSWPDLERYYPEEADRDHINGIVRITVTLDNAGRATDTHILSETPANRGFGAAASTVAHLSVSCVRPGPRASSAPRTSLGAEDRNVCPGRCPSVVAGPCCADHQDHARRSRASRP
jgi:TonB family protein